MALSLTRTTDGTVSNANANLNNNWTAIETLLNGNLDATNLAADAVGQSEIAANAVTTAEILDAAVTLAKLASSSVDNSKVAAAAAIARSKLDFGSGLVNADIAAAAGIVDSKLASPNNSAYRSVMEVVVYLTSVTANTRLFSYEGMQTASGAETDAVSLLYLDDANYAVAGVSLKLQVRGQLHTNATAPAITFTFGLYPITAVAGGASNLTYTAGAVVSGSTVAFASPGASSQNGSSSGDFAFPADGFYALGVVFSGTSAASSAFGLTTQLQLRAV